MNTMTCPGVAKSISSTRRGVPDATVLAQRSTEDTRLATATVHKFAAHAADQMAAINRAAASGNAIELAARAHALKNIASELAADDLMASAAEVEHHAPSCKMKDLDYLLARIQVEIDRFLQALPVLPTCWPGD